MPALPAVVNAAVAAKYFSSSITSIIHPPTQAIHSDIETNQEDGVVESKEEERRLDRTFEASKWSAH